MSSITEREKNRQVTARYRERNRALLKEKAKERREEAKLDPAKRAQTLKHKADYRKRNRSKLAEKQRQWREQNPELARWAVRQCKYGITFDQYQEMIEKQNGCCAVCDKKTDKLEIDHDHKTGRLRGLLCHWCNKALGFLRDDLAVAQKALSYLEKWKS
jgi:hypothetical protein